ncbi:MAG: flagellin [Balneolaceae bacterium]
MRITEFLSGSTFRQQVQSTRAEVAKYNEQVATGKRVTKGSDNAISFTSGKLFEDLIRRNEQYQLNISTGLFQARTTQDALDQMKDLFISMKTLTIEAASENKNADDRLIIAERMKAFKDDLIDLANTKFNDVYIFGGTNSDIRPFFEDPGEPGDVGTDSTDRPMKVLIGDASVIDTTVSGIDLRNKDNGDDLFETVQQTIDALENNDTTELQNSIDRLNNNMNHVVSHATKVASNINRLEFANERIEQSAIDHKSEVSRLTDADIVESMLNFQSAQTSYESVLAIQSQMMQTSLLNYLR